MKTQNTKKTSQNSIKQKDEILKMVLAAMFLALAYVLPFLTGQIPDIGNMLLPMHLPVLLCGFICGGFWGLAVGLVAPLLRSFTLGMPTLFPKAICMAIELAAYGAIAGFMYKKLPKKNSYMNTINIYISLITAMVAGRIIWGFAMFACLGFDLSQFGLSLFWAEAVTKAIPGIIVQIVLIPLIVMFINKKERRDT